MTRGWNWRYVRQFVSGRTTSRLPVTKHAVADGATAALCNRRPYWRLQPEDQRWLDDPDTLDTLKACTECEEAIEKLGEK